MTRAAKARSHSSLDKKSTRAPKRSVWGGAHTRSQAQTSSVETGWAPHRVLQLAALVGEVPQAARINNEPPPLPHLRGWEEGRVVVLAQKQ